MSYEPITVKHLDLLTREVEKAKESLNNAKSVLNNLNGHSQTTLDLTVGGIQIPMTYMGRETGWMARPIKEFDDLRCEVVKGVEHLIWMRKGKLEGAIFALDKACKQFAREAA